MWICIRGYLGGPAAHEDLRLNLDKTPVNYDKTGMSVLIFLLISPWRFPRSFNGDRTPRPSICQYIEV